MPPNTVYVGRPTRWGNPYSLTDGLSRDECIRNYEVWLTFELVDRPDLLEPLRDKDLACWCPLNKPCHADVLLKFLEAKL